MRGDRNGDDAAANTATSNADTTDVEVYKSNGFLFHPELNFKDKVISIMLRLIMPYHKVYNSPISKPMSDESMKRINAFRDSFKMSNMDYENRMRKIKEEFHWTHISMTIPRQPNILSKWNIIKDDNAGCGAGEEESIDNPGAGTVKVIVHGPSDLLDTKHNTIQVVEMERRSIPIVVYFHGGGMIAGSAEDSWPLNLAEQLLKCSQCDNVDQHNRELMVISVDYGLSPEHPFPYPIVDGLSVMDHLMTTCSTNCSLHVAGMSAGGNLAAVTTMETIRYAPGRLRSSFIMHPMLDPMANTESHHTNDEGSMLSSRWIHWCWKAYLNVQTTPTTTTIITASDEDNTSDNTSIKSCKNKKHIHKMKNECKWLDCDADSQRNAWQRLINPSLDLPSSDDMSKTKIIITAAKGDILFHEGYDFAQKCLQQQRKNTTGSAPNEESDDNSPQVTYIETSGDHALALETNPHMKESIVQEWAKAIFSF